MGLSSSMKRKKHVVARWALSLFTPVLLLILLLLLFLCSFGAIHNNEISELKIPKYWNSLRNLSLLE